MKFVAILPVLAILIGLGLPPSNASQESELRSIQKQSLVLGLGCFWGAEKRFEALPGVLNVVSGYADGRGIEPTYKAITQWANRFNENNFAEVIKVDYNQSLVSTETLIKIFFEMHDPTQRNRQGNDVGTQYRSTILFQSEAQQQLAQKLKAQYQLKLNEKGYGEIQTIIKPLDKFYKAETYHQDYIAKNPNGYCPDHSTGVTFGDKPLLAKTMNAEPAQDVGNTALLKGKQIVVVDAPNCPYCEKFKEDVTNLYQGDIPLNFRLANQLDKLTIKSPTFGTPTILFLEDGVEQFGHMGYMSPDEFYQALGWFKVGDSEAFRVAFNKGTDNRFCKAYEKFKDTPPGQFVDRFSGKALFDTRDRFNSGTGWLSFTKPIDGAVTYHEDRSFGMVRTEVKAKVSGIHLGHVFDDGPNGAKRYCINATVLDFVPDQTNENAAL